MNIAIVGVCASGQSTLAAGLRQAGFNAYTIAQEHSCIHKFWQKHHPDVLVMIDATMPAIRKRRIVPWGEERLRVQHRRLADARAHADLYIQTDELDASAVRERVISFLTDWQEHHDKTVAERVETVAEK